MPGCDLPKTAKPGIKLGQRALEGAVLWGAPQLAAIELVSVAPPCCLKLPGYSTIVVTSWVFWEVENKSNLPLLGTPRQLSGKCLPSVCEVPRTDPVVEHEVPGLTERGSERSSRAPPGKEWAGHTTQARLPAHSSAFRWFVCGG